MARRRTIKRSEGKTSISRAAAKKAVRRVGRQYIAPGQWDEATRKAVVESRVDFYDYLRNVRVGDMTYDSELKSTHSGAFYASVG